MTRPIIHHIEPPNEDDTDAFDEGMDAESWDHWVQWKHLDPDRLHDEPLERAS